MSVKVKICGLTNLADAQSAVSAGVDLLGFIFYPKSSRYVTPEQARNILTNLDTKQKEILTVGVFVNESAEMVAQTLGYCGLNLAQLHGDEPPEMLGFNLPAESNSRLYGRAYKALRPCSLEEALSLARIYALPSHLWSGGLLPALLLDTYHPQLRGGTGETGDWNMAAGLARHFPLLLAGGLTPANVRDAIRAVNPWGVDIASGIESSPGQKDHAALSTFVKIVKKSNY